jgi:heterodisulfide reductase subunit A
MEVAHMAAFTARPPVKAQITPAALVIGGGVAGLTAALELAEAGVPVTLVERTEALGGQAITDSTPLAKELVAATQAQPGITVHLGSYISQVEGSVGAYHVTVTDHASRTPAPQAGANVTQHGPFGAIIVATGAPDGASNELANLLRLPQDRQGFLPEWRVRLRPGNYIERGIFVCGSAHYLCDTVEAQFQAYSAASRVLRHVRRGSVAAHGPVAQVDPEKCNGCGDCLQVCPFSAVTMVARHDETHPVLSATLGDAGAKPVQGLSLSIIDPLLCTGCGNCVSICPVAAVTVAGCTDTQLEAQMEVALGRGRGYGEAGEWGKGDPRIPIFACEWSGYAAAELAGAQKLTYPPNVRLIRLDCSGRLQPGLILKAFEMGAAGVLVLGCAPRLCHYERGNERAAAAYEQVEAITGMLGLPSTRLRLAWTPPDDGPAFAHLVTGFVEGVMEEVGSVE